MDHDEIYERAYELRFDEIAEEFPNLTDEEIDALLEKEGDSFVDNYYQSDLEGV